MSKEIVFPSQEYYFDEKAWFEVKQLDENIWGIREPKHFEDVISYLIVGKEGAVLVDTGMGLANIRLVLPATDNIQVLLTHTHWDHMGGVSKFKNVAVFNNPYETNRLEKGWLPDAMDGFQRESFLTDVPDKFDKDKFLLPGIDYYTVLNDNNRISLGNLTVRMIHTPGHTPGNVCYFLEEQGYLFTGDTLYPGPEYPHLTESSAVDYYNSLTKLSFLGDNIDAIFPGHNSFKESIDLLKSHLAALSGKVQPSKITFAEDFFGKYVERFYHNFSFKLPNPIVNKLTQPLRLLE